MSWKDEMESQKTKFRENPNRVNFDAADDDGSWITTENGHHVHLNEEGIPDKGNPHVISAMTGGKSADKKSSSGGKKSSGKRLTITGPKNPSPKQAAERTHLNSIFNCSEQSFINSSNELANNGLMKLGKEIGANVDKSMDKDQLVSALVSRRKEILSQAGNEISVSRLKRLMKKQESSY